MDFCNWLHPLSLMFSRFIQVIAYINNSFILIVKYTTMWIIFLIKFHHLFHFRGALMNNVSMNIHAQIFLSGHLFPVLLGIYLGVELQDYKVTSTFVIWKQLFSEDIHHFVFPGTVNVGYNSSTILPYTCYCLFLKIKANLGVWELVSLRFWLQVPGDW